MVPIHQQQHLRRGERERERKREGTTNEIVVSARLHELRELNVVSRVFKLQSTLSIAFPHAPTTLSTRWVFAGGTGFSECIHHLHQAARAPIGPRARARAQDLAAAAAVAAVAGADGRHYQPARVCVCVCVFFSLLSFFIVKIFKLIVKFNEILLAAFNCTENLTKA